MSLRSRTISLVRRFHLVGPARFLLTGARRVATVGSRAASELKNLPSLSRLGVEYRRLVRRGVPLEPLLGSPDDDAIAIIVCLWNRPERLEDILRIVDGQRASRRLRLVLWNNRRELDSDYRDRVRAFHASGALTSIEWFTSPHNVGGIGRFLALRELVRSGYRGSFVMMDDDQDFTPSFVEDLLAEAGEHTIAGVWAWINDGAYWNRTQVEQSGHPSTHVGTGGSVCDSAIVSDSSFFTGIPLRFLFMEDMWMSQYARRNGWTLKMVASPFSFVLSELDQGHSLFPKKEKFFTWMNVLGHIPEIRR